MASKNRNLSTLAPANTSSFAVSTNASITGTLNTADVNVSGNLIVTGTTVTVNVATLDVKDLNITVAKGAIDNAAANGAGLTVDPSNAQLFYASSDNSWNLNTFTNISQSLSVGTSSKAGRITASPNGFNPGNSSWTNAAFVSTGAYGGALSMLDGSAGYSIWVQESGSALVIGRGNTNGSLTSSLYTSNGNIGIGTNSPNCRLNVYGDGDSNSLIQVGGSNSNTNVVFGVVSTNTGFVGTLSNHDFILRTNNTSRVRITANGDVGIGTVPSNFSGYSTLTVNGSTGGIVNFLYNGTESSRLTSYNGALQIDYVGSGVISLGTNGSERMRISSTGNVGIGTNSPSYKLDISGDTALRGTLRTTGSVELNDLGTGDRNAVLDFHSDDTYTDYSMRMIASPGANGTRYIQVRGTGGFFIQTTEAAPIEFLTGGANSRLFIGSGGNVGIGTNSPGAKLHVLGLTAIADDSAAQDTTPYGSLGVTRSAAATSKTYFAMTRSGNKVYGIGISADNAFVIGEPNNSRDIQTERFRITTNGNSIASVDLRAPIFYDNNDTGYYLDPNSNSNMWQVTANDWFRHGGNKGLLATTHSTHFYSIGGGQWTVTGGGNGSGGLRFLQNYENSTRGTIYWDANGFGLLNSGNGWILRGDYGNGNHELYNVTFANDIRTYIMYDRNDTGYRVDPTGDTVLVNLRITNSLDFSSGSRRYLFRDGRMDAVNLTNTAWETMTLQGGAIVLQTAEGSNRFSLSGGVINLNNGSGSRGASGRVLTTPNDSVANAIRANMYIEWTTDVGAIGTSYFNSDIRKKENIKPSTFSSIGLINKIDFIEFDWKPGSGGEGHVDVGMSAQQLQELDDRLVSELSDGYLMIKEPILLAYTAKAIQEQQKMIEELRAEIALLKNAK